MYRTVIFDFDGTIIDTEQHLFNVINKHSKMHNADSISIDFYHSSIGGAATDLHDHLIKAIDSENKDKPYEEYHLTSATLPMIDTTKSLMVPSKQHHIPTVATTSSMEAGTIPAFKALGLDEYIEMIVGREDVEQVKPDSELYLSTVRRLNYILIQCLTIENPVNGATAAIAAGLDAIVSTNKITSIQDFSNVDYVIKDISYG